MNEVETLKHIQDAIKQGISFREEDYKRLKQRDREYSQLATLLNVFQSQKIETGDMLLTISPRHQVEGKNWQEILNMAVRDHVEKQPVWHERVQKYIDEPCRFNCGSWCRADHTGVQTKHNTGCDCFDWFCELHYMTRTITKLMTSRKDETYWIAEFLSFIRKVIDGGFNMNYTGNDLLGEFAESDYGKEYLNKERG